MTGEPLVRVVRGEPDDFELAAVTVVLAALLAAEPEAPVVPEPRSGWADRSRSLGIPAQHAPGAWNS
ncbi:acyl-CoA carboxylase subunit epsilon [Amycolatopsis lurida]